MADVQTQQPANAPAEKKDYVADAKAANTKYNTTENREKAKKFHGYFKKAMKIFKF